MPNKNSFSFLPTAQDLEIYIKNKISIPSSRAFMKDYRALHHIKDISDTSVAVYNAIRNLMSLNLSRLKKKEANLAKFTKRSSVGKKKVPDSIVGMSMIITDNMLQEWIGNKSRPTIKNALNQLEQFGFIKSSVDTYKRAGRTVTLLRDIESYQPEEVSAMDNCISLLGDSVDLDSLLNFLESYHNSDELSGPFINAINNGIVDSLGWNSELGEWSGHKSNDDNASKENSKNSKTKKSNSSKSKADDKSDESLQDEDLQDDLKDDDLQNNNLQDKNLQNNNLQDNDLKSNPNNKPSKNSKDKNNKKHDANSKKPNADEDDLDLENFLY